jgi:uncharacterized protein (TIGR02246 family)
MASRPLTLPPGAAVPHLLGCATGSTTEEAGGARAVHAGLMTSDLSTDQAAIAAVPERVVRAWAKHDADAFAGVFTTDGTLILPGLYLKGHDDIRAYMSEAFAGPFKGTQVTGQPIDLRVHGDMGVVVTLGGVLAPGETEVSPQRAIRATWVVVKNNGEWRLAAYQNSPVSTPN